MKAVAMSLALLCLTVSPVLAAQGRAVLRGTAPDSKISGEIVFNEEPDGLGIKATVTDAPPGTHGFHIHEKSSCDDQGKAAGDHFNPDNSPHGFLPQDGSARAHAGDLGNIEIGPDGKGTLTVFAPGLRLTEGRYAVTGRAVILHEKADDFGQPSGNAGSRIACGLIETGVMAAKP